MGSGHGLAADQELGPPLGARLKVYFDDLTAGPVPDHLLKLTEALEAAFERGDLKCETRTVS